MEVVKPIYDLTDIQAMIDRCGDDFVGRRDKAIIIVLHDCGLRVSELMPMTLDAVDTRAGTLLVRSPKGSRQRGIAMGEGCETTLSRYLRCPQEGRHDPPRALDFDWPTGTGQGPTPSAHLRVTPTMGC